MNVPTEPSSICTVHSTLTSRLGDMSRSSCRRVKPSRRAARTKFPLVASVAFMARTPPRATISAGAGHRGAHLDGREGIHEREVARTRRVIHLEPLEPELEVALELGRARMGGA